MSSIVKFSVIVLMAASCTEDRGIRAQSEIRTTDGGSSIESTADDGSNGAVVFVPTNSDVDPADVRVEEGAYVAKDVTASYLTVPGKVTPVSAAIGFYSEVAFTSKQMRSIVLTIPIDFELAKNVENLSKDKLAVFYHVYTSELGDEGAMQFGVIPSSMIEVIEMEDGGIALSFAIEKIQVNGRGFGVYQLANFVLDSGDELIIEKSRSTRETIKRADGSKISINVTPKAPPAEIAADEESGTTGKENSGAYSRNSASIDRQRNWTEAASMELGSNSYVTTPEIIEADGAPDGSFIVAISDVADNQISNGSEGGPVETIRIIKIKDGEMVSSYSVDRSHQNHSSKIFVDHKGDHLVSVRGPRDNVGAKIKIMSNGYDWSTGVPKIHVVQHSDTYLNHLSPALTLDGSIAFNYSNFMGGATNEKASVVSYNRGEFAEQSVEIESSNFSSFNEYDLLGKTPSDLVLVNTDNPSHGSNLSINRLQDGRWHSLSISPNNVKYSNFFYHLNNSLFALEVAIDSNLNNEISEYKSVHSVHRLDPLTGDVVEESVISNTNDYYTVDVERFFMAPNGDTLLVYAVGTEFSVYFSVYR